MNPSLANRLRIGFAITFALLAGMTVVGVGRLFQLRQDFEDATSRSFQREVAGEHLRQAFLIEQAALRGAAASPAAAEARFAQAQRTSQRAAGAARRLARGDRQASALLARRLRREKVWEQRIAEPFLAARPPPLSRQTRFAQAVIDAGDRLISREGRHRAELRDDVTADTRETALLVGAGLISGLIAAVLLFGGLIASMRKPLERLVDAAGRIAGGDMRARVEVSGPAETAKLGQAFNEMADELQRAYDRVEVSRRRLAVTLESLSDGVVTVDAKGRITDANPAAERLLPAAAAGSSIRDALGGRLPGRRLESLLAGQEQEELHVGEGEAILAITGSALGGPGKGTVLSIRDISERARLERMKDEFVLTASHELRSPLTSVQGFAELLMIDRENLSSKQAETVEIILDNTRHLVRLLNDLLDLARSDAGRLTIRPVPTDIGQLVEDAARTMRAQTEASQQTLVCELERDLPEVLVEPDRIRQVLVNLLTNAHDYSPERASIRVTAARIGDEVEITVSDDGPGIPEQQLDEIFARFTRGDAGETQRIGGTGLGLAISKSLVELHGGTIAVSSVEGEGATFRVSLPVADGAADGAGKPVAQAGERR